MKLNQFIKRFGLFEGLSLWYKFRYGKTASLKLSELKHEFYITPNSIDNASFTEIFLDEEYSIEYPKFTDANLFIIDAGANIGLSCIFYANKFSNSTIIAIEPDAHNLEKLNKNVEKYENIETLQGAIWHSNTSLEIVDKGWGTRGFMIRETTNPSQGLKAFSIQQLMEKYNQEVIHILKMDIEGSEKEVFESNYEYWLPRTKCLIVELHDRMKEGCSESVFSTMDKYNFDRIEKGENYIFINNDLKC